MELNIFDTDWQSQLEIAISVVIAAVLGGVVGMERELANRPAGLRTHALLASAGCLLIGLGDMLIDHFISRAPSGLIQTDPIRIVEAIVTGTAFLGAGTIFRRDSSSHVEGLTTAASLLVVAAIGVTVALHKLVLAVIITVLALVLLRFARKLET